MALSSKDRARRAQEFGTDLGAFIEGAAQNLIDRALAQVKSIPIRTQKKFVPDPLSPDQFM